MTKCPKLLITGGADVDKRLPLMLELRDQFDCVAVGSHPNLHRDFADAGFLYENYQLNPAFDLLSDWRSFRQLRTIMCKQKPDIVHCFDTKPCIVGQFAAQAAKAPVRINTFTGLGGLYTYNTPEVKMRRAIFRQLHRIACSGASRIVFQNGDDQTRYIREKIVSKDNTLLIKGSGVDAARFNPKRYSATARSALRYDLGIPPDAKVILFVGRLLQSKGIPQLLDATKSIASMFPNTRFVLVGPKVSEHVDALTDLHWSQIRKTALWLGERSDIPELMMMSDLLVLPTYYREGIPRALQEAAMLGLPIVTTDTPGCREVVASEQTGLAIPIKNSFRLIEAIIRLLNDKAFAQKLGRSAREKALREFKIETIANQYRQLYKMSGAEIGNGV